MKVKDILPSTPVKSIEVRAYRAEDELFYEWGIFCGACSWDGDMLISKDGDDYYLDDEIVGFLWRGNNLTYWVEVEPVPES